MKFSSKIAYYRGGIFDDESCKPDTNHALALVGYGTDKETGKEYVIIRNSYGTNWGEEGYARVASHTKYSPHGVCGWANYVWEIRL